MLMKDLILIDGEVNDWREMSLHYYSCDASDGFDLACLLIVRIQTLSARHQDPDPPYPTIFFQC